MRSGALCRARSEPCAARRVVPAPEELCKEGPDRGFRAHRPLVRPAGLGPEYYNNVGAPQNVAGNEDDKVPPRNSPTPSRGVRVVVRAGGCSESALRGAGERSDDLAHLATGWVGQGHVRTENPLHLSPQGPVALHRTQPWSCKWLFVPWLFPLPLIAWTEGVCLGHTPRGVAVNPLHLSPPAHPLTCCAGAPLQQHVRPGEQRRQRGHQGAHPPERDPCRSRRTCCKLAKNSQEREREGERDRAGGGGTERAWDTKVLTLNPKPLGLQGSLANKDTHRPSAIR